MQQGLKLSFKCTKLVGNPLFAWLMNHITPTHATWNGMNRLGLLLHAVLDSEFIRMTADCDNEIKDIEKKINAIRKNTKKLKLTRTEHGMQQQP